MSILEQAIQEREQHLKSIRKLDEIIKILGESPQPKRHARGGVKPKFAQVLAQILEANEQPMSIPDIGESFRLTDQLDAMGPYRHLSTRIGQAMKRDPRIKRYAKGLYVFDKNAAVEVQAQ